MSLAPKDLPGTGSVTTESGDFGKEAPFQRPSQLDRIEGLMFRIVERLDALGAPPPSSGSGSAGVQPRDAAASRPSDPSRNPSADWVLKEGDKVIHAAFPKRLLMVLGPSLLDGYVLVRPMDESLSPPHPEELAALRLATPAEIQQWEQEQEAKKPLVFGIAVEYEAGDLMLPARYVGPSIKDEYPSPPYPLYDDPDEHFLWTGQYAVIVKRSKFKVIEP